MSDARLRQLERSLAAHPTPETRDRLAAERARRGDGPWLPVPYYDDAAGWRSRRARWSRDFPIAQTAPGCFIFGGSRLDAVLVDLRPAPRGVSAFWSWVDPLGEAQAIRASEGARGTVRIEAGDAAAEVTFGEDA